MLRSIDKQSGESVESVISITIITIIYNLTDKGDASMAQRLIKGQLGFETAAYKLTHHLVLGWVTVFGRVVYHLGM